VLSPATDLKPTCQTGEFTVGGGYDGALLSGAGTVSEISGDYALGSSFAFNTWVISGGSSGGSINANALCIRIPMI
jgi:hypothetical protein